ncbi:Pleckstrin homology domain-containing family A member 7 [Mizuhopecten yessoensis]|uniref:Pleckstrin homology domain-containing family A member 7 n=1 Tax=Mizuhopecten yessoensis TaxID=6573 RepID=A0A210QH50_MIZYE|nr:Pleckstrin homology domain-containing family A member 7 [Mizuhopecten yessoensis]
MPNIYQGEGTGTAKGIFPSFSNMAANLPRERLPAHLSYGVTRDGRVFFIDDRLQTTSWLHPLSGVPIQTGHKQVQGLPRGWEQAVTQEGAIYYIDHNKGTTTFDHPWEKPKHHAPSSPSSPPAYPPSPGSPSDKQIKINSPNKLRPLKAPPAKRDDNAMVTLKGWLYRQESGSWKTWKKRWCVLSNFGLFFYKDDKESHTVGSILLPSYRIEECGPADTSKKFAFKAEHNNMKTYMFASDTQDDRTRWIEALKCAAVLKNPPSKEKETNNNTPLPKLIPKSPFMTWDDDEDEDDDQTPRGLSSWQNMLSKGNDPGPSQPTTQQPHKSPQDVRGAPEGHYPKNDPRFADGDPQQRGNQQGRDDPRRQYPGNHARPQDDPRIVDPRNRYLHDPHHGEDYSPQPNNPRAVPQPQEHRQYSQHQSRPPGPEQHISDPYTHSNTHKDRQRPNGYGDMGNQGQLGQGEQDPYSYSTKHHKHPGNMQQRDARQDPRQDPRQFDSRLDPRHDPRQMEPQQIDPRHDPHQMDPRQIDPRHDPHQMDPRQIDPRHGPHHMDPRQIHPRHDPNQVDPQQMNPRHDPYHMDPHQMDPRHDPHQMDPRQIDPRQMDPSHDHRQIDPQQDPRYSLSNKDPYVSRKADSMPAQFVRRGEDQSRRRDSLPGHYNKDRSPNSNRGTDISPNSSLDPYSGRKSDSLPGQYTGGRDISPNASNYSDAAYDRYSGQPNIPQQSGRVPDPQDPYSMDQYNPGSRSQDPGPRSHDLGYSEGPNQRLDDREEVMMSHRDVPQHAKYRPSKHDTPSERSSDIEAPRQSEYDGFYSPTRESKQRELANRPLPAIKVSNKTENPPVKLNTHHQREDTDDGYSTLTKYQEQRRKKAQDQLEAQQLGPRSQHDLYDHDQAYPRQQEQPLEVRAPENQNEALHTYVNLPDRASLRDLQDRDVGVEYIEEVPERPPLPTAVRKQIVQEIAQAKTPRTSEELLEAERALETRMQQPSYFDYPTPVFPPKDHPVFDEEAEPASRQHGQRSNNSLPRPWNLPAGDEYTRGGNTGYYDNRVNGSPSRERTVPKQVYAQGHQRQPEGDRRRKDRTTGKPGEGGRRQHGKMDPGPIHTVKEDPDMADEDVIEFRGVPNLAKKYPLSGGRIRMSISAGDLIGKTHDELVLLLIQLRREHADLEKERNFFREKVDQRRASEQNYRRLLQESDGPFDQLTEREHYEFMQLRSQLDDAEKRLEVYRPMVNLVHNMVNMGSLYGGDNFMLASQYRKHLLSPDEFTPPKKMLEFSRKHQEEKIVHGIKEDIKQLSSDEVILEDKLEKLYELDRRMHEQSYHVAQAQEDKDMLEKALQGILRQQDMCRDNIREQDQLIHQQRTIEKEISRVMHQLAKSSGDLEETTAENNMIEHEVALLRSKVTGELSRSKSAPSLSNESLRNKMKMEKDLAQVKNIMAGLNQQGAELSEAMNTLRRSSAGAKFASAFTKVDQNNLPKPAPMSTYFETDLDSAKTTDLSQVQEILISYRDQTPVQTSPTVTVKSQHQPIMSIKTTSSLESSPSRIPAVEDTVDGQWDIEEADDNTKRFFGILPKDKPKTLTVRDVKRQSEQRKEQLKVRKETEEDGGGEPWSYNGVDTEQPAGSNYTQPSINNQGPIYENLPPSHSAPRKTWSSVNALATPGSAPNSRRSSALHLMMPRPFVPFGSQPTSTQTSYSSLNVDNQSKTSGSYRLGQSDDDSIVKATRVIIQPQLDDADTTAMSPTSPPRHGMFSVKRTPRGRYMTISSSQPVKLETTLVQPSTPNTAAGDLIINRSRMDVPDIVQSSQMRDDQTIDTGTIDKEILFVPDKVLIPERYNPESDEEDLTEEDQARRQEKSEKIKKLLAQQSIHSISQPDVSQVAGELHKKVEQEKVKRAELLQVGQELARQVTLKTRQAAAERRKTWSGSPAKSPREREMEYNFLNGHDSEVLGQTRDDLYGQAPLRMQEKLFI